MSELEQKRKLIENLSVELAGYLASLDNEHDATMHVSLFMIDLQNRALQLSEQVAKKWERRSKVA